MKRPAILLFLAALLLNGAAHAQNFATSERLRKLVDDSVAAAVTRFAAGGLTAGKIAITAIDLNNKTAPAWASHRGEDPTYPASVVKLFYLVAAHQQMQSGALQSTLELDRALRDMIVDSSNDATHFVFEKLTDTTDGPELEEPALREWIEKRSIVNRYFAGLGYKNINVNQKTWCEGPYGRERQALGPNLENRNKLTTEAVARLFYEIVTLRAVSRERSQAMMNLLHRDPQIKSDDPDNQASGFGGKSLPPGSQYYSKAGWTSTTRHDAAYVRLPNGAEYILAIFTVDNSKQTEIIPFVAALFAQDFGKTAAAASVIRNHGQVWSGNSRVPWAEAIAVRGQ